jgi:hypothetical protein
VREAVANIALELSKLPDDTIIEVEAVSLESIHPHDLYAYKRVTLESHLFTGILKLNVASLVHVLLRVSLTTLFP